MSRWLAALLLLLLAAGCARAPFAPAPPVATRPLAAEELLRRLWPQGERTWTVRQTALFELRGAKMPMSGLLRLDSGRREARLVGLDDLGVKLFDVTVTAATHEEHYLLPELARLPAVGAAIAGAVRHIFLVPQPAADDLLQIDATQYRLTRSADSRQLTFVFGGPGAVLLEKRGRGGGEDWRARYFDYRPAGEVLVPGGILFEDERAGYRLTLWLEEAKTDD